jgi:hypothetical protein
MASRRKEKKNASFVNSLSSMLRSVVHRVENHKVAPAVGNERGNVEINDYVVLPRGEDNRLPPLPLILGVTPDDA